MSETVVASSPSEPKPIKLPYFHRTLTPQEQALIGDITPKQILTTATAPEGSNISAKITESSAWNGAKTWEERDCSSWAKSQLALLFKSDYEIDNCKLFKAKLGSIEKIDGDAHIAHSRGKARYMYEYSFQLKLQIKDDSKKTYSATVLVADIISDQLNDIEVSIESWSPVPSDTILTMFKNELLKSNLIKSTIIEKMKIFEDEYRKI